MCTYSEENGVETSADGDKAVCKERDLGRDAAADVEKLPCTSACFVSLASTRHVWGLDSGEGRAVRRCRGGFGLRGQALQGLDRRPGHPWTPVGWRRGGWGGLAGAG